MACNLRHTQTKVNQHFASGALPVVCVRGKIGGMRVRLEEIRGDRRLEDLADELEVSISTVQRWEKGSMAIPSLRLPEIARAYGCAVTDIFAEDHEVPKSAEVVRIWDHIPLERRAHAADVLKTFTDANGNNS